MRAFSLANASHLPVTGESHPLVRESLRWLTTGNAVALGAVMLVFGALYAWSELNRDEDPQVVPRIVETYDVFPSPPPIYRSSKPQVSVNEPVAPQKLAVPDPVPDSDASDGGLPTNEDWSKWLDRDGPIDGPVEFQGDQIRGAQPDSFVAFDELPVLLSITAPVYPDLARQAGIDGTVMVKVLVTRAGKVRQAVAVEGPEPLWAAAVDAAKTALFKPALQGDNPVEVWVMIPVTFSINR